MTRVTWGQLSERFYESGVDRGVLYPEGSSTGVAWSGLMSISENVSGATPRPYYYDGIKYLNIASAEEFEATIQALGCPPEFDVCCGIAPINNGLFATQQVRKSFSLTYRTLIGNPIQGLDRGYKIHLVYNALASASQRNNQSLSDSSNPVELSWTISTRPPTISGFKPTSHFVVDSRYTDPELLEELEDILYGSDSNEPEFPTVEELLAIFA